jgi:GNAT superfamily N-acetyltransferase
MSAKILSTEKDKENRVRKNAEEEEEEEEEEGDEIKREEIKKVTEAESAEIKREEIKEVREARARLPKKTATAIADLRKRAAKISYHLVQVDSAHMTPRCCVCDEKILSQTYERLTLETLSDTLENKMFGYQLFDSHNELLGSAVVTRLDPTDATIVDSYIGSATTTGNRSERSARLAALRRLITKHGTKGWGELNMLCTSTHAQGRGVGKLLLAAMALESNWHKINMWVLKVAKGRENAAVRFYEHRGFTILFGSVMYHTNISQLIF